MLIITGPGRSGTSVLALFCKSIGYDPGGAWYEMVDAGLEHERVVQINDALRREARETGGTAQALQRYGEEMRNFRMPVIKDPRFTRHPEVLRAWRAVRDDLSVVVTYRHPEHCLASLRRRARFVNDRRHLKPDDIRCQMADCVETLLALEIPFEILLFPDFLGQCDQVCTKLQSLGLEIDRQRAEHVWAEIVDRDKVHVRDSSVSHEGDALNGIRAIQHKVLRLSQRLQEAMLSHSLRASDQTTLRRRV